ncbi:polysaccharide biosynthesis protein [Luteimonas mephitis]|uniref:polysaccharide biosynthesis protein n=1 Tax=Luteimonas mephitis TaxID=83615 RepID=UPI003A91411C
MTPASMLENRSAANGTTPAKIEGPAGPHSAPTSAGANMVTAPVLSTRALEERRLIHRQDSARAQADAFRDLRTRLLAISGSRNFVVLVASVSNGCGGSFVARNLALAFAFDESKAAVLVDCDALHPSQHTALGVAPSAGGLMDYLDGSVTESQDIRYATGVARLQLIPNGSHRETAGEHFSSARARAMIESLRNGSQDRFVILDAPPVLNSPDARILSDLADMVVLVAGYGKVTLESIDKAAANFEPAKLAGIVFNELG